MKQSKVNKTVNISIRLLIVVLSCGYIAWKLFGNKEQLPATEIFLYVLNQPFVKLIAAILIFLMIVNWLVETIKWRYLIKKIERVSFRNAVIAVLTGITVSIFTPNRVGEYFGRAFLLREASPLKAILLTIVGSMSQLLVTVVIGSAALLIFLPVYFPFEGSWNLTIYISMLLGIVTANTAFLLFYFNVPLIGSLSGWVERKNWSRIGNYLKVLNDFSRRELFYVLMMSLLRYFVFSFQFYLVLRIFGVPITLMQATMAIPVIYLALAAIPTVALSELGVRGSVAIFVLGIMTTGTLAGAAMPGGLSLAIVTATTVLWIINLAVPALIGAVFVYKLKFIRQ